MSTDLLLDLDAAINEHLPVENEAPEEGEEEKPTPEEGEEEKPTPEEGEEEKPTLEEGEEKPKEPPPKKPPRSQQRIETLARERAELRRENEALRRQVNERPPELPPQPNPQAFVDKEGNFDQRNFDFAVGKWKADVEHIQKDAGQAEQRRIDRERDRYTTKMQSETSIYGEYHSSVRRLSHLPMTAEFHDALLNEDNATDLFCFLGAHPDIADSVLTMRGYSQSRKLAEIALKLREAGKRSQKKPSAAAPPPKKLAAAPARAKKPYDKYTPEEWAAYRGYKSKPK